MQVRFKNDSGELLHAPDCLKDFDDMFEGMRVEVKSLFDRINWLQKENKRLQEENYKDEELTKMKKELDNVRKDLYRGFGISQEENESVRNWEKKHNKKYHQSRWNGAVTYMFVPTNIGTFGSVCCDKCRYKAMRNAKGDTEKYNKLLKEYDAEFTFQEAF